MCVTNIYVDRYPNGREAEFRKLSVCQYGYPGRPCPNHTTLENPVRKIQFNEATAEQLLTAPIYPSTPPHTPGQNPHRLSGGSHRRYSVSPASSSERHPKPYRHHRKERIIIVDAPPTPRTPPQIFNQTFTAPSSPNPRFTVPRGRPIIVDERSIPRPRASSIGAARPIPIPYPRVRSRSRSRPSHGWDTPRTSHTSIEREERERRRRRESDDEARRRAAIAAQDADIRRRAPVPLRPILKQTQTQTQELSRMMGGLSLSHPVERVSFDFTTERRRLEREQAARQREVLAEEEAQRQRLRERQMPKRRFSVGPGHRRSRVVYDDGVYRWE